MVRMLPGQQCPIAFVVLSAILTVGTATRASAQSDCSPALSNRACTLTINREAPSNPQTVKLNGDAVLTLRVIKRPLESVTLDTTLTDVAGPDPLAQIAGAFLPVLKDVIISAVTGLSTASKSIRDFAPTAFSVTDPVQDLLRRLHWIDHQQDLALKSLADAKKIIDAAAEELRKFRETPATTWTEASLYAARDPLAKQLTEAGRTSLPSGVVAAIEEALKRAREAYAALALRSPSELEMKPVVEALNGVAANQAELLAGVTSLQTAITGLAQAAKIVAKIEPARALRFSQDFPGPDRPRSLAAKVNVVDQLSKASTHIATVTATWGTTRWELSTGPLFSWMQVRTFQNSPRFVDGAPVLADDGKVNTFITESTARPTVVPFVLGHYRLGEVGVGAHRIAGLVSGGLGVNPHSKSVDFAGGVSVAYRLLVVSYLGHRGRDLRLLGGLQPDDSLGSSPPALATERFWRTRKSVAISVRIPF